jgi:ubiquinone/menaquinone biosynthesis C-methylase UbiE
MAAIMNRRNRDLIQGCVEAIAPRKGSSVADVGFGGGAGLRMLVERVGLTGIVTGVEPSESMRARALKKLHDEVALDRLRIVDGTAARTTLADGSQAGIISVNTVYFWPDLDAGLEGLARALGPGGALALGIGSRKTQLDMGFDSRAERVIDARELADAIRRAGLVRVSIAAPRDNDGPAIVRGYAPA